MRINKRYFYLLGLLLSFCLLFFAFAANENEEEEEIRVTGIRVHQDQLTLPLGEMELVRVTVYPANATDAGIYWQVSDPQILAVTDLGHSAQVNALAPGTAVLTAVTRDGGFWDSCTITTIVLVRTLSLEPTEIELLPGEELALQAIIEPPDATDQRLEWESSDPVIATVSGEGIITAHKTGKTRIIVRSMEDELISDYINVTVLSSTPAIPEPETPPLEPEPEAMPTGPDLTDQRGRVDWLLVGGLAVVALLAALLAAAFFLARKKKAPQFRPVLKGLTGYFAGQAMELTGEGLVIGRDPAQARLVYSPAHETISRKHCILRFDRDSGQFILEDFSSTGTFLSSGEKLTPGLPRQIAPGEQFYLSDPEELFTVELLEEDEK